MDKKARNIWLDLIILIILMLGIFSVGMLLRGGKIELMSIKNISSIFINRININETYNIAADQVNIIKISSVSSKINVYTHNDNQVKANFYGDVTAIGRVSVPYLEVKKEGKTALVKIRHPKRLNIGVITGKTTLDVWIPEGWDKDIFVDSASGDIELNELSGKKLSVEAMSGRITGNHLYGEEIFLDTASGDIGIRECTANDKFQAETMSGKINVENLACNKANVDSASGDIKLYSVLSSEKIVANSISGTIDIQAERGNILADTTSGDIKVRLKELESFKANSTSGSVYLEIPDTSDFNIDIETLSGSIQCRDFNLKRATSTKNKLQGTVGNGKGDIRIETTSGNVTVNKS
ncbi:MAG: DUF4097 domain-containing protein [Clostridiaceae bacterium]|nr:DUF4097 domain-containing protein [Clostridiaceae bacterium]